MADADEKREDATTSRVFQEALARVRERLRQDPNWSPMTEYRSPYTALRPTVSPPPVIERIEPPPRPQPVLRAALPFGQRLRDLRRALGWTQRDIAWELGVSARTVIRYEQGRSAPLQAAPLLALRRLESEYAEQLDSDHARV